MKRIEELQRLWGPAPDVSNFFKSEPAEKPRTHCRHEPDPRLTVGMLHVQTEPGINSWMDDGGMHEIFVCRLCGSIYAGMYDVKNGGEYSDREDWVNVRPTSEWEAPMPVECPDCLGSGKGPPRTIGTGDNTMTTDTCIFCYGLGKKDPREIEARTQENEHIKTVIDDLANDG